MKKSLFAGLLCVCILAGIQLKAVETVTKDFKNFTGINLNCSGKVHLKQGNEESFVIKCDKDVLPKLNIYMDDNTVQIRQKDNTGSFFSNLLGSSDIEFDVYVTMKKIDSLSANASGEISVEGNINSDNLFISSSSSGELEMNNITADSLNIQNSSSGEIKTGNLTVKGKVNIESSSSGEIEIDSLTADSIYGNVSSSGEVEISGGNVNRINVDASSSGEFKAEDMSAKNGTVSSSSAGKISAKITEEVNGNANSGGDIYIYGNPKTNNTSSNSGGSVRVK